MTQEHGVSERRCGAHLGDVAVVLFPEAKAGLRGKHVCDHRLLVIREDLVLHVHDVDVLREPRNVARRDAVQERRLAHLGEVVA